MPRMTRPALPEPRELPDGRREYQFHLGARSVAIGLGVLAAVILLIVVAAGGDGGSVPDAPPPDAPLERQLDGLDRAVEALP